MSLRSQTPVKLAVTVIALILLAFGVYHSPKTSSSIRNWLELADAEGKTRINLRKMIPTPHPIHRMAVQVGAALATVRARAISRRHFLSLSRSCTVISSQKTISLFAQQVLSKFDGKRLVADPSTAFDGDVIREFPYRQARKAKRGGSDEHHKRIPTSMFLMADHPQPVALSASTEITPRPNPSPRRFVAAYDVISMVPSIPIHRLVGRPSVPDTWSAQQRAHFLTHPDDPRYGALAEEIAQEVDLRFSGDDIVKALAIKDYLEREGFYTRKERHAGVEDPAASFLFGSLKAIVCTCMRLSTCCVVKASRLESR